MKHDGMEWHSKHQTASGHQLELTGAVVVKLHLAPYILEMAVPDHGGRNGSRSSAEYLIRRTHAKLSRWFSKPFAVALVGCKAPPG